MQIPDLRRPEHLKEVLLHSKLFRCLKMSKKDGDAHSIHFSSFPFEAFRKIRQGMAMKCVLLPVHLASSFIVPFTTFSKEFVPTIGIIIIQKVGFFSYKFRYLFFDRAIPKQLYNIFQLHPKNQRPLKNSRGSII